MSGYCTMSSRSRVSSFMCMAILYSSVKYQAAYERCGCVFSLQGKNYNITSMESADDTARFTVEHNGYMFSYNPCRSFHFLSPPSEGDCQDDMAMCYWLSDRMYEKIAYQSTAKCGLNAKYNLPMLQYTGDIYIKKTTVLLKCEPSIKQPNFTVVDDNDRAEFVFELTHECACPELCVVSPSIHTTKDPTDTTGRMTFFGWVRYILWMIVVEYSFQSQGSDGSYLTIDDVSPMSNGCSCPDREGKLYNFEPLGFKNETPSLKADGAKYEGYSYSYNPCHPFKLGPENGGCPLKAGVAICKWVPSLKGSAASYIPIGHQEGASCDYDEKFKTPVVKYEILSPNQFGKSTVIFKCAEGNGDKAIFEILDEDDLIFQLTHFWDVCPSKSDPKNTIAAAAVSVVVAVTGLACLVRYFRKKRNENNDNGEIEQLLRNGNVIHNPIEELNREIGSRPTPIGSSHTKADVNVIRSAFNWF